MKQIENEKLNEIKNEIATLNLQKQILNNLNEILKIYPEAINAIDNYCYQKYTDKKYITDSIKNSLKTTIASIASLEISEEIINTDIPLSQKCIIAFIGSLTGWLIFQIENTKRHEIASLNKKEIIQNLNVYTEQLIEIIAELEEIIQNYTKINGYEPKINIKEAFDNNEKYILKQKQKNNILYDFDYETIKETFEEMFGENGLENCIDEIYKSIEENKTTSKRIKKHQK